VEPLENQYKRIGRIAGPHGLDGTVLVVPESGAADILERIDLVRLQDNSGNLVPARVESVRVQQEKKRTTFFVKFNHITDKDQALQLKKRPVFISKDKLDDVDEAANSIISYSIRDENHNELGTVKDVLSNPAHPILVVQNGDHERLIPFADEYIVEVDDENSIIYCQNMQQLSELQ
jgi:16S rRNA processing protein RimM